MTQFITAYTLVDITDSGTVRIRDNNTKEYHQQQNLNVLLQTIGLRTQPFDPVVNVKENQNLDDYEFSYQNGHATVWTLKFHVDHEMVWSDGVDQLHFLKEDLANIAITVDLDDTVDFGVSVFDASDKINVYFRLE